MTTFTLYSLQVGSIVRLRSGGPAMTIISLPFPEVPQYGCQWFDGAEIRQWSFPAEALYPVNPDNNNNNTPEDKTL